MPDRESTNGGAGGLEIDYRGRLRAALVSILRDVLVEVAEEGFPGEHHLYVSFATDHPDAAVPAALRSQFPEQMTIVLEHQFWDLEVDEAGFSVTLRFGGQKTRIGVPFAAVRAFVDPAAEFGLDLAAGEPELTEEETTPGNVVSFRRPKRSEE